jgi:hypothetical protein
MDAMADKEKLEQERLEQERDQAHAPEDRPDEPGAEGGSQSPASDKLPGMPAGDDPTPVGDTDQHSKD